MLLLVLILVVIAFGLLVVALLAGSVLWAWVSVGVSVVAAVVLLVDWLQRRSAVKAGSDPVAGTPARPIPMADLDPATEILPIVPASARGGSGSDARSVDRTDRVLDAQQTVLMPVVQPSGSSAQPSGAEATITSSSVFSSPSVTKTGADSPPPTATGDGPDEVTRTFSGGGETVSISKEAAAAAFGRKPDTEEPKVVEPAVDAAEPAVEPVPAPASDETVVTSLPAVKPAEPPTAAEKVDIRKPDAAAGSPGDVEQTVKVQAWSPRKPALMPDADTDADPVADAEPDAEPVPASSSASPASVDEAVQESAVEPSTDAPATGPPVVEAVDAAESSDEGEPAAEEPAAEEPVVEARDTHEPVAEVPVVEPVPAPAAEVHSRPVAAEAAPPPRRQEPMDLFASAPVVAGAYGAGAGAPPPPEAPPGPLGEAPEEQPDQAAAELVRRLDDEVVVVDEQPRYHVGSCRALASTAVIPLPVREAVELGFTPCGWCSPDRTLAGRHPSAAR